MDRHELTGRHACAADAASVARYQPDGATVSAQLLLEVIDRPENEIVIRQALEDEASNPERIDEKYPYAGVPPWPAAEHEYVLGHSAVVAQRHSPFRP